MSGKSKARTHLCCHRSIWSQIRSPGSSCPVCTRGPYICHHCLSSGFQSGLPIAGTGRVLEDRRKRKAKVLFLHTPHLVAFPEQLHLHCSFSFFQTGPLPISPSSCLAVVTVLVPMQRPWLSSCGTISFVSYYFSRGYQQLPDAMLVLWAAHQPLCTGLLPSSNQSSVSCFLSLWNTWVACISRQDSDKYPFNIPWTFPEFLQCANFQVKHYRSRIEIAPASKDFTGGTNMHKQNHYNKILQLLSWKWKY